MDVGLVLTRDCNLACGYCFAGDKKRVRMDVELGKRAVDFAIEGARLRGEPLEIELFGGEPLLEWETLKIVSEHARERAASVDVPLLLQMTTNGTLLDDDKLAALLALDVRIALSVDGLAEVHDAARPTRGGAGSFEAVSRALDRLLASGRPFDVITVVDAGNVTSLSSGVRGLLDRGVDRLTLNPNWGGPWTSETLQSLRAEYEAIAAIVVAWFGRGRSVAVQPFDSALVSIARGESAVAHRCEAGRSSFAVGPSGKLFGCARAVGEESDARAMGDLESGLDIERARAFGAAACPGACACACVEETGDPSRVGPVQTFHQKLIDELGPRIVRALVADPVSRETYVRVFQPVNVELGPTRNSPSSSALEVS